MSFMNPWGLLALVGIPLVLYFHRRMAARRRMVPLVMLWHPGNPAALQGGQRRRFDPILLLRLLIVVGVALALARPSWPVRAAHRHLFLLDASASMLAREEGGVRFQQALEAAGHVLDQLPPEDEAMALRAGTPPTVVHELSRDRRSLRAALAAMSPGETPKDLSAGLALARQALGGGRGFVHVFSDLRSRGKLARLGEHLGFPQEELRLHSVGGRADNLGIIRLEAAPVSQSPLDHEIFAVVANFSGTIRTANVSLYLPEGRRDRRDLSLAPGERKPVIFTTRPAPWVEVRIEGSGDALAVDDRASLVMASGPLRVLYASRGDRFLDAALRAHPRLQIQRIPLERLRSERWSPSAADVAAVDGMTPPPGFPLPALVFAPEGPRESGGSRAVPVVEWQRGHPLLRQLDLDEVRVPAGAILAADSATVLIRSADGPVARVVAAEGVRRVETAFAVSRSNLGELPAFPVLMARALDWLSDHGPVRALNVQAGQPFRMRLPDTRPTDLTVRRPDGSVVRVAAADGYLSYAGTDLTGRYLLEGPGVRFPFTVNLVDPEESNVDRPAAGAREDQPRMVRAATDRRDLSRPLLAVALPLLSLEVWLFQRKRRARGLQ